jgi:hypothetical protein
MFGARYHPFLYFQLAETKVKNKPYINLLGLVLNKYTVYPFNLFASLFNSTDLAEGYVVSAIKAG